MPAAEMRHLFRDYEEACDNTLWIAERADVEIEFDNGRERRTDERENALAAGRKGGVHEIEHHVILLLEQRRRGTVQLRGELGDGGHCHVLNSLILMPVSRRGGRIRR